MEDLGKDFPQILPLSIKIQKHTFTKSSLMVKNEGFVEKFPKILPSYLHCLVKKGINWFPHSVQGLFLYKALCLLYIAHANQSHLSVTTI